MKKIIIFVICIISIFLINCACVSAKEPDKANLEIWVHNSLLETDGYAINGRNYYKIDDIIDAINKSIRHEKIIIDKNKETDEYQVIIKKALGGGVYAEDFATTEPSFRVYPYKVSNAMYGETVWATEDLETGERNAYITKDPYVYMRDRIFRPNEDNVDIISSIGKTMNLKRYEINGEYYYDIEDICAFVGCEMRYSEDKATLYILTQYKDYYKIHMESMDYSSNDNLFSYSDYGSSFHQYIYDNKNGTFSTFDVSRKSEENIAYLSSYTYDKINFEPISNYLIPVELNYFHGFFSGEKYNFIAFGSDNENEILDKEILRIVKYDKNFNRLASLSLTSEQCHAIMITKAGTMRMAENGSELVIHTSRLRLKSDDGLNHQSQLSLVIDTENMTVKNYIGAFQSNHVSHSFDQFVKYDGNDIVYLDLGDAYPRAIVINTPQKSINVLDIPGEKGDNYTGVSLGGFEITDSSYIVTYNYNDFDPPRLRERNAYIAICDKNDNNVKHIKLTDLYGTEIFATAPVIFKSGENRFLVMWSEFHYDRNIYLYEHQSTKYVEINKNGDFLSEIHTSTKALSPHVEPLYMDNGICWYRNTSYGRVFYKLSLDPFEENPISVVYDGEKINFDQKPVIENGRTLVPLRAIFEKIGADVEWNGGTQTVTATKGDTKISLTIDNTNAKKNNEIITLDVPAKIVSGRTLVPVRFVSDCFGVDVEWVQETQTVLLTTK